MAAPSPPKAARPPPKKNIPDANGGQALADKSRKEDLIKEIRAGNSDTEAARIIRDRGLTEFAAEMDRAGAPTPGTPPVAGTAPKLDTLLTMPGMSSASVAAAEEASLRRQAKRGGRASTLLGDPSEQPLAARDIATEEATASARHAANVKDALGGVTPEELIRRQAEAKNKKKKLVAMGLYTTPTTVLGG